MGSHRENCLKPPVRRMALERAGYCCERCHASAPRDHHTWCGLDVNHIEPWDMAGSGLDNLSVLCLICHQDFTCSKMPYEEWRATPAPDRTGQVAFYIPRGAGAVLPKATPESSHSVAYAVALQATHRAASEEREPDA